MFKQMFRLVFQLFILSLSFVPLCSYAKQVTDEKSDQVDIEFVMPPYARFLKGFRICLDPGHGGQGHIPDYKRGPTGLREAVVNLKVAFFLRELLEKSEATVIMTRIDDTYVSLAKRSQIANQNNADFFISLHHNGLDDNPDINYTSTWYHGDADESHASLNLARYIQQGVSDAMRLPKSTATGLYSDKLVVASGFGVLRLTKCPAVVCEASFYTNPEEEERLRNDDYLKKEAYGYYLGIARYVEAGFPKGMLITPEHGSTIQTKTPTINIQVHDGIHERGAWMLKRQQVFSNSIQVKINDVLFTSNYDREKDIISVVIDKPLSNGTQYVQTELVNYYGNHNLPKPQQFKVAPPASEIQLEAWTDTLPSDGVSYVGIIANALDMDGMPIADEELIKATTTAGTLVEAEKPSKNGTAHFYLVAPKNQGTATFEVSYRRTSNSLQVNFNDISYGILQGQVTDADSDDPIPTVELHANPELTATTDTEGHFYIKTLTNGQKSFETILKLLKIGYYPEKLQARIEPNKATILNHKLHAIADGAYTDTVFVLDTQTDVAKSHQLIASLKEMLELAGAKVYAINSPGLKLPTEERIKRVNNIKEEGFYLQINHTPWSNIEQKVIAKHNRGNQDTETFQKRILEQFNNRLYETPIETVQDRETPIIQQTNKMAMILEILSLNQPDATVHEESKAIFVGIWLYLKEETEIDKEKLERYMLYYNQTRGD